jgi:uncharacterized protein (DUF2252 family)
MPRSQITTTLARERAAAGKLLRKDVPREAHGHYEPASGRPDPLEMLDALAKRRLPFLIPLRDERIAETPFTYFRGTSIVMACDLANTPKTGLTVQACGDAHCLNFGGFASPERNLLFDVNDFDETLPGPWEWDVKRLVTSILIAGRDGGHTGDEARAAASATAAAYRLHMRTLATLPALDVWYARLDATKILDEAKTIAAKRRRRKIGEQVATETIHATVEKLTSGTGFARRFIEDPPKLFHSSATEEKGFDVDAILTDYRTTLSPDMQHLLSRYRQVDHAMKVVGVGSVGTRCAIALFVADDHDPLLLQVKEALPSVLEGYVAPSAYATHGERVVRGQRLMQAASDAFLGWASSGKHDFYVRQFKDMKASADLDGVGPGELRVYGRFCAYALAAAHARSGDAAAIAGYLGAGKAMDRALVEFAEAYADQNEADYVHFSAPRLASGDQTRTHDTQLARKV